MRTVMTAFAVSAAAAAAAAAAGDIAAGREVARTHCTRCHVVADMNPNGGIGSTPSFQLLVERRPDYRERFATFFARRPHPSFLTVTDLGRPASDAPPNAAPIEITLKDVADLAAYAETLKGMSRTGP